MAFDLKSITPTGSLNFSTGFFFGADSQAASSPGIYGLSLLMPLTTQGDLYVAGASGVPARLAVGSNTQVLTVSGGVPTWQTPSGSGGSPGGSSGQLQYNSSGSFAGVTYPTVASNGRTLVWQAPGVAGSGNEPYSAMKLYGAGAGSGISAPSTAPFEWSLSGATFLSNWDDVMSIGYNSSGGVTGEPYFSWNLETSYYINESGTNTRRVESYWVTANTPSSSQRRPIGYAADFATGANENLQLNAGVINLSSPGQLIIGLDSVGGPCSFNDDNSAGISITSLASMNISGGTKFSFGTGTSGYTLTNTASGTTYMNATLTGDTITNGGPSTYFRLFYNYINPATSSYNEGSGFLVESGSTTWQAFSSGSAHSYSANVNLNLQPYGAGQVNITSGLNVASGTATPSGGANTFGVQFGTTSGFGVYGSSGTPAFTPATGALSLSTSGAPYYYNGSAWVQLASGSGGSSNPSTLTVGSAGTLSGGTADVLDLYDGTNAQKFNIYNTRTDASNYERAVFDWKTTSNLLRIGTEAAGTGTVRNVEFVGGSVGIGISPTGVFDIYIPSGGKSLINAASMASNLAGNLGWYDPGNGQVYFGDFGNGAYLAFGGGFVNIVGDYKWNFPNGCALPNPFLGASGWSNNAVGLYITKTGNGSGQTVQMYAQEYACPNTDTPPTLTIGGNGITLKNYTGNPNSQTITTAMTIAANGNVAIGTGTPACNLDVSGPVLSRGVTYTNLPASPVKGMIAAVTDATVSTVGSTVSAGGGSNSVMAWYNGSAWKVFAV